MWLGKSFDWVKLEVRGFDELWMNMNDASDITTFVFVSTKKKLNESLLGSVDLTIVIKRRWAEFM